MKKHIKALLGISILLSVTVYSCKKNSANPAPKISITKPVDGATYLFANGIPINFSVHDEDGVGDVVVHLQNLGLSWAGTIYDSTIVLSSGGAKTFEIDTIWRLILL